MGCQHCKYQPNPLCLKSIAQQYQGRARAQGLSGSGAHGMVTAARKWSTSQAVLGSPRLLAFDRPPSVRCISVWGAVTLWGMEPRCVYSAGALWG